MLLGATGTGKSATTAWLIEQVQRPTLVMAPNKTLAAQLANEFRELLPNNAVEYFVSYYDYYQPEAYVPQTDTYIEKDSSINDEVERLRHSRHQLRCSPGATSSWSPRCPASTASARRRSTSTGWSGCGSATRSSATTCCASSSQMQYTRNDLAFTRGTFRVRGDTVEIIPVYEELAVRIEFFGDEIEAHLHAAPAHRRGRPRGAGDVRLPGHPLRRRPGAHGARDPRHRARARASGWRELEKQGKLLEAQRLRMRTTYDIEMMRQVGSCSGIENYSLHIDGRAPGHGAQLPARLLPRGLPARHRRVARHRAADRRDVRGRHVPQAHPGRPRLPAAVSAMDNRPLKWEEFLERIGQTVYLSATPGPVRAGQGRRRRRADHPADRPDRPRGHRQADQGPDRRPAARDPRRAPSRTSASWSPR